MGWRCRLSIPLPAVRPVTEALHEAAVVVRQGGAVLLRLQSKGAPAKSSKSVKRK